MKKYVLALDQGTTRSRCILFDKQDSLFTMRLCGSAEEQQMTLKNW